MSLTGLHLRRTARRALARALEALAAAVDVPEDDAAVATPPAEAVPVPPPEPPAAVEPPRPLPPLPAVAKPKPPTPPELAAARVPRAAPAPKPAGEAAKASPEDRQRQLWERTRRGLLRFVHEQGGRVALRELHDHSDTTYHVAHVGFSRMMEELTDQGLLAYDHDTALAAITDAGRAEMG